MPPALLAPWGCPLAPAFRPATDAVQTIEPDCCLIMCGMEYLIARNGPIRLMRSTSCQCSTVCSGIGTSPPETPALAQIASSLPYFDTALSMKAFTSASEPASAITASTVPPASPTSLAVSFTPSARSTITSLAPSLANRIEAARPRPLPAPVVMPALPSRRPMNLSLVVLCGRRLPPCGIQTRFQTMKSLETLRALTYSDSEQY